MKKRRYRKFLLKEYPELYKVVYGDPKPKKPLLKRINWFQPLKWILYNLINTPLNSMHFYFVVTRAKRKYKKTGIHRHVVPIKKFRCGFITGADLVSYNKRALKYGMKRFKYKNLKKESYFTTDTLQFGSKKEKIQLIPIVE